VALYHEAFELKLEPLTDSTKTVVWKLASRNPPGYRATSVPDYLKFESGLEPDSVPAKPYVTEGVQHIR
jgi:hypothetical protein